MATPASATARHSRRTGAPASPASPAPPAEMKPQARRRWPLVIMLGAASLSAGLGVLVVAGWHSGHIVSPMALLLESAPVRYNAGLLFVLCGAVLLLLAGNRWRSARVLAAVVAAGGLLTGCEYFFHRELGIDELLFRTSRVAPSLPARMAPNTAACFALLGIILLLATNQLQRWRNTVQAYGAALVATLGLVGFIGYVADIPTAYGWGRFTPMAAPTAAVMVVLGLGAIAFAWRQHMAVFEAVPSWSPLLAALTLAAGTVALWQALHVQHPQSKLDILALVVGLLQAATLYLVLRLLRGTRERARLLRQLNSELQTQVEAVEHAEREVREKQAYTRSLIEASLDPLVTIAPDGKITDVNAATEKVTGRSRQELIGSDFSDYFTDSSKARAGYQQVFREGGVRDYELQIRHVQGQITPVLYNASVYHDQAGQVIGVFAAARDVTERRRLEQELLARQSYTRSLIEASLDPLATIAPDGKITDVNTATEAVTGCSRQQLIGTDFCDYFTDPQRARAGYQQAFREGGVHDYELEIRHRNGHLTPVLYNASIYRDQAGQVSGVFAAARDVAERKRLEEELRAGQAYTRSLIEASLDPLVTIAPDGKITDVNAATEAVTGCSRQQLIGTDFCDYFTDPQRARAGYQQAFREGGVHDYELEIRHRNGHVTPVLYNASIYRDQAGQVSGVFAAARDVTERKRLDGARRESEERYRALAEASSQVVWTTPPDGRVEDMPMWREHTGQTREQVRGWGWLDAVHPDDRERTEEVWSQAVKTHTTYQTEYRIRGRDGQYRHFAVRGVPVLQEDGRTREWVGACTDIHERKQIEDELRKQAILLNLAHDAIIVFDLQYRITFWNRGAEETYGWSAREAIGRHAPDLLQTKFPVPLPEIQAAVQQEGEWEGELEHVTRDGRSIFVASRWSLQRDHHGAPASILEINRDITERKRAEEELRLNRERLLLAQKVGRSGTFDWDIRNNINSWTPEIEELYGLPAGGFGGTFEAWENLVSSADLEQARDAISESLKSGEFQGEWRIIRPSDGQLRWLAARAKVLFDEHGQPSRMVGINIDITERKRLEDSLRQRTLELENSVAELEAFSYSVSHDLRAPLRSLDGFSQILLEDYRDNVDAEGQDYLRRIRNASQNMGQLIDALLQLSRVMRSELARERVDLSILALSTAALVQKADPGRRVCFRIASGLEAQGDRRLLGVALQNLLQNAWKFSARSPRPMVEFGRTQKDGKTAYYVRDNGVGFDMAYVNKLFTPFQRLHAKDQFEGTGIGLATVQRVFKRHGGRVWAEGAVGKGATFYFSFD